MPTFDTYTKENSPARIFCYGAAKTKKTWWSALAAEAGYRVLVLDGDKGTDIIRNLTDEARSRIYVIDLQDYPEQAVMAPFLALFTKNQFIYWDEAARRPVPQYPPVPTASFVDARSWRNETVVVVDSWTALVESLYLQYARENNIDMTDAEKTEWDGFGWTGRLASLLIARLCQLPCHLVVVGHATQYEKRKTEKIGNTTKTTVEWSRRQAVSTSGPHAMKLPVKFDDVLFFEARKANFSITAAGDKDADGGSRHVEPKTYPWLEFPIWNLLGGAIQPAEPFNFSQPPAPAGNQPIPVKSSASKPKGKLSLSFGKG